MKRLFTFGCSHTKHYWPTWAHILSLGCDEFYNFGKGGTGNFRILNQIMRANEHFKFTKDDYVGIALSCNYRYDIIEDIATPEPSWVSLGSMLDDKYHTKDFQRYLNDLGGNENTITIINCIKKILNDNDDNVNYKIFSAFEIKDSDEIQYHLDSKVTLDGISKSYGSGTYYIKSSENAIGIPDGHYTIPIHLRLVKDVFSDWYDDEYDKIVWKWEETMPDMHSKMEEVFGWVNDSQYEFIGNELIKLNK